jgi:hypothetical protein
VFDKGEMSVKKEAKPADGFGCGDWALVGEVQGRRRFVWTFGKMH